MPEEITTFRCVWVDAKGVEAHPHDGDWEWPPSKLPDQGSWSALTKATKRPVALVWSTDYQTPDLYFVAAKHGSKRAWDVVSGPGNDHYELLAAGSPKDETCDVHRQMVVDALGITIGVPAGLCWNHVRDRAAMDALLATVRKVEPKSFADRVFVNFLPDWTCLLSTPTDTSVVPMRADRWGPIAELTGSSDPGALFRAVFPGPQENASYGPRASSPDPTEVRRAELEQTLASAEGRHRLVQELGRKPPSFTDRAEWELMIEAAARAALHESPAQCFEAVATILTGDALAEASGALRADRVLATIADELGTRPRPVDKRWAAALMEWGQHPQLVETSSRLLGVLMSCPAS